MEYSEVACKEDFFTWAAWAREPGGGERAKAAGGQSTRIE